MTRRPFLSIDTLKPGKKYMLQFHGYVEEAEFVRIHGEGEERTATFLTTNVTGGSIRSYSWDAYRHNKRWVYGTGAQRISVLNPVPPVRQREEWEQKRTITVQPSDHSVLPPISISVTQIINDKMTSQSDVIHLFEDEAADLLAQLTARLRGA